MILPDGSGSWIIVRKSDGAAIAETFLPRVAAAVNREKYEVLTAHEYLGRLNATEAGKR
jgi:hypothetical protein